MKKTRCQKPYYIGNTTRNAEMIKSVSIQNFEAHQDTTIHFGPGLNLICGLSNSGKSSILRAIRVVVNNDWDKEMVRSGYEFCRIKVETDRGWVEAERGEKVNRWRCQENGGDVQLYRNVGIHVPDLAVKILGMCERDRGNGIKELPNFQTQLERHYMLSEIGEKKATSNMIAVMMDNAIGLGGIEGLIKDFSGDLLSDRKWLTEKNSEINELKTEIIDDAVFAGYERAVGRIDELDKVIAGMEDDLFRAERIYGDFIQKDSRMSAAAERLSSMRDVQRLSEISRETERMAGFLSMAEPAARKALRKSELLPATAVSLERMENLLNDGSLALKAITAIDSAMKIESRLSRSVAVSEIDCESISRKRDRCEALSAKIAKAEKALSDSRELWRKCRHQENESNRLGGELAAAQREFKELKKSLGICPMCGGKLTDD